MTSLSLAGVVFLPPLGPRSDQFPLFFRPVWQPLLSNSTQQIIINLIESIQVDLVKNDLNLIGIVSFIIVLFEQVNKTLWILLYRLSLEKQQRIIYLYESNGSQDEVLYLEGNPNQSCEFDYIVQPIMKRRSNSSQESDKQKESGAPRRPNKFTFDFNNNIECFLSTSQRKLHYSHSPSWKSIRKGSPNCPHLEDVKELSLSVPRKNKGKIASNIQQPFNNTILLLEYEEESKHQAKPSSMESGKDSKSEEEDQAVKAVVNSCLQVITEDTQNSSNPVTARYSPQVESLSRSTMMQMQMMQMQLQMQMQMQMQMQYNLQMQMHMQMMMPVQTPEQEDYYLARRPAPRNRRAVSSQQQHVYIVDPHKVTIDGRTTVMIRNIPNKYTQQMLLELFELNHKKKFDFFYLPIDYSNNCNVGYAFLNFIHAKFIVQFYHEFHNQKWKLFNSEKVCKVCYARIQGTQQLERHFKNSNVIQQQNHIFRPLIGMESLEERGINEIREGKERYEQA